MKASVLTPIVRFINTCIKNLIGHVLKAVVTFVCSYLNSLKAFFTKVWMKIMYDKYYRQFQTYRGDCHWLPRIKTPAWSLLKMWRTCRIFPLVLYPRERTLLISNIPWGMSTITQTKEPWKEFAGSLLKLQRSCRILFLGHHWRSPLYISKTHDYES